MIVRALVTESNVTKTLNIALQLIATGEARLGVLQHSFTQLPFNIAPQVDVLAKKLAIFYNVSRLLAVYLLNKMQLDYPLSQEKLKRQLRRENHVLAREINARVNMPNLNPFGHSSDPFLRLLHVKHLREMWVFADNYERTELKDADTDLLNISIRDIVARHVFEYNPAEDIIKLTLEAELQTAH